MGEAVDLSFFTLYRDWEDVTGVHFMRISSVVIA